MKKAYRVKIETESQWVTIRVLGKPSKRQLKLGWDKTVYFQTIEGARVSFSGRDVKSITVEEA